MALLLLIVIGVSAGWLASVIGRTEKTREILVQIGAGLLASIAAGLFMNSGTILGGLSLLALGSAIGAAILVLIVYHVLLARKGDA